MTTEQVNSSWTNLTEWVEGHNVLAGFTSTQRLKSLIERKAAAASMSETDLIAEWKADIPLGRFL